MFQIFLGDAIATTCHLINRMLSSVLNGDIPYSCLFPNRPLFGVIPQVFDTSVVHVSSPGHDNLLD